MDVEKSEFDEKSMYLTHPFRIHRIEFCVLTQKKKCGSKTTQRKKNRVIMMASNAIERYVEIIKIDEPS